MQLMIEKHFINIIRGVMLKGVGLSALYNQLLFLVIIAVGLIVLSVKKFKNNLE